MPRLALALCLLLLAALPAAAESKVREGPGGAAFYTPPTPLPAGAHGAPIWARKGAAGSRLLLYRSTGVTGKAVAVSATLSMPKGRAPQGGWPVVSWAHGTTGIADRCAPSRGGGAAPRLLERWRRAGYAIVRTDYEGLGTPGDHPYLIGRSEGRAVLDAVRAARRLDPRLGRRFVIAGHSQGGHAALWAASLAPRFTPELRLRGTVAFAPASHLGEQGGALSSFTQPSPLSGLVALILRGVDVARPDLGLSLGLTEPAAALYPRTLTDCIGPLVSPGSFGGLAPAGLIRPDVPTGAVLGVLAENDPEDLTIRAPVRVQQGTADTTVFKAFTDPLVDDYRKRGVPVTYRTYEGVDHGEVVTDARSTRDATRYLRARLR
jgi:pimeloyl-ACP methyl ester carboxylesterase